MSSPLTGDGTIAVVVAYNRRELLAQTLDGLAAQTVRPRTVVVVDNASDDGSGAMARAHPIRPQVVTLAENFGGAGGFAAGIAVAVAELDAAAVWIMDDDTIPEPGALEALLTATDTYPGPVALCASRAVWHDGREHPMNTPRERPSASRELRERAQQVGAVSIRSASFVSILIDARAVREVGLPIADYFLWNDDFEYTARILRNRVGLYVPASRVLHATKQFGGSSFNPGPRFFNEVRNKVWMFCRSRALRPAEKVVYGGRTALRWLGLLVRSPQRKELMALARKGLQAARRPPRPNSVVLADTPMATAVAELE
ncbi:MAG: glycosyltransferase [Propioniciclava sp.]